MEIKFQDLVRDDEDLVIDFLTELYPGTPETVLRARFDTISTAGWRCVAALVDGVPTALGGYWINTRFWCGRYMYLDHFLTRESERSLGVGSTLVDHLVQRARDQGCEIVCFDSFVGNEGAQKLGRRLGFENVGLHFVMDVAGPTCPVPAGNGAA
jgi:GNAT superfamily N-acetyltransferase